VARGGDAARDRRAALRAIRACVLAFGALAQRVANARRRSNRARRTAVACAVAMPLVIVVACRRTVVGASSVDGLDARATRSTLLLT
jgi:hypothetical protein